MELSRATGCLPGRRWQTLFAAFSSRHRESPVARTQTNFRNQRSRHRRCGATRIVLALRILRAARPRRRRPSRRVRAIPNSLRPPPIRSSSSLRHAARPQSRKIAAAATVAAPGVSASVFSIPNAASAAMARLRVGGAGMGARNHALVRLTSARLLFTAEAGPRDRKACDSWPLSLTPRRSIVLAFSLPGCDLFPMRPRTWYRTRAGVRRLDVSMEVKPVLRSNRLAPTLTSVRDRGIRGRQAALLNRLIERRFRPLRNLWVDVIATHCPATRALESRSRLGPEFQRTPEVMGMLRRRRRCCMHSKLARSRLDAPQSGGENSSRTDGLVSPAIFANSQSHASVEEAAERPFSASFAIPTDRLFGSRTCRLLLPPSRPGPDIATSTHHTRFFARFHRNRIASRGCSSIRAVPSPS